jgi:hypothetical protein
MHAALVVIACFDDWKRFCFVLREIASGENGRPLSGIDAQRRAQAVLVERGYSWPTPKARERMTVPDLSFGTKNLR